MKFRRKCKISLALISLLIATACVSEQLSSATPDTGPIYTQAAYTVVAGMTETAQTDTEQETEIVQTKIARGNLAAQTVAARMTRQASTTNSPDVLAPTATLTVSPTSTQTPSPLPTLTQPSNCDRADFLADISSETTTVLYPGEVFRKTWRFQNVGRCTWTPDYRLVMVNGEFQGGTSVPIPMYVQPGQVIDITTTLVAPGRSGSYTSYWNLRNTSGQLFGFGPYGEAPLVIQTYVVDTNESFSYNFATNYCAADWRTGAGMISCSGIKDEAIGFVIFLDYPILENGDPAGPSLWTLPNNSANGWISGTYPPILIRQGDHFKSKVGCLYDIPDCNVLFQVEYETMDGSVQTLGRWRESYNGLVTTINIDLSPLAGQYIRFIFTVTVQNNQPLDANNVWAFPRIGP